MKLARNDSVVIVVSSLMVLMTNQVPNVSQSCDHVFMVSLCGIDVIVHTRKVLRRHLHKSTWFYVHVIIKRMRKQWIPGALSPILRAWVRGYVCVGLVCGCVLGVCVCVCVCVCVWVCVGVCWVRVCVVLTICYSAHYLLQCSLQTTEQLFSSPVRRCSASHVVWQL